MKSAADCDANKKEQTCPSGYSCGKLGTEFEAGGLKINVHGKGCYPENQCKNAADTILKSCKDAEKAGAKAECDFSCCDSDLCNGGTAPVVSALLMVACALVAFLR